MLVWFFTSALAGTGPWQDLAPVELARAEGCVVEAHAVAVRCKKGVCAVEETLTLAEPSCTPEVTFSGPLLDGAPEPVVQTADGWALPMPCASGLCVKTEVHPIVVRRVFAMDEGEGVIGRTLMHGEVAPTVDTELEQAAFTTEDGGARIAVYAEGALKKPPVLKAPRELKSAKPTSVDYYGPVDKGLRDGLWEERSVLRHPIARQVTYERGVRLETGPWEAHTVVDDEGIARRVPQLAACPREATIETMSGGLITQSCTWSDDDGSHALVASFLAEPWTLVSIGEALNGGRHGEAREFWPDGSLKERSTFYEGRPVGMSERWHEDGTRAGTTHYRVDGGVQRIQEWSPDGNLVLDAERVPGMGANLWTREYLAGRLIKESVPLDALQSRTHVLRDGGWQVEEESVRRTPPPDGQCFADVDCESGICTTNACVETADPASYLDGLRHFDPDAAHVAALDEHGRKGWVAASVFGGESGCVAVTVREGTALRLDSEAGSVDRPLGLGAVDDSGATWSVGLVPLTASCVPSTDYVECGDGGFQACASSELVVHAEGETPKAPRLRKPYRVGECGLECGPDTCKAEAGRVSWLLRDRWVRGSKAEPVRVFWEQAACE